MASLEGLELQAPSWLVGADSGGCCAFRVPLLLFESAWKLIWLAVVAGPLWTTGRMDAATWETAFACSLVIVVLAVIPWQYVWARYVIHPAERWR